MTSSARVSRDVMANAAAEFASTTNDVSFDVIKNNNYKVVPPLKKKTPINHSDNKKSRLNASRENLQQNDVKPVLNKSPQRRRRKVERKKKPMTKNVEEIQVVNEESKRRLVPRRKRWMKPKPIAIPSTGAKMSTKEEMSLMEATETIEGVFLDYLENYDDPEVEEVNKGDNRKVNKKSEESMGEDSAAEILDEAFLSIINKDDDDLVVNDLEKSVDLTNIQNFAQRQSGAILHNALSDYKSSMSDYYKVKAQFLTTSEVKNNDDLEVVVKKGDDINGLTFDEDGFAKIIDKLCDNLSSKKIMNSRDDETMIPDSVQPMAFNTIPAFNFIGAGNGRPEMAFKADPKRVIPSPSSFRKTISNIEILKQKRRQLHNNISRT